MGDAPTRTERGFAHYQLLDTDHGHTIKVFESSSATAPCLWLQVDAESSRSGESGSLTAHLRPEQVDGLIDRLIAARDGHYQREGERGEDARPAEPADSSASAPDLTIAGLRCPRCRRVSVDTGGGRACYCGDRSSRAAVMDAVAIEGRVVGDAAAPVADETDAASGGDVVGEDGEVYRPLSPRERTLVEALAAAHSEAVRLREAAPDETGDLERLLKRERVRVVSPETGQDFAVQGVYDEPDIEQPDRNVTVVHVLPDETGEGAPREAGDDIVVQLRVRRANLPHLTSEGGSPVNGAIALRRQADGVYELEAVTDFCTGLMSSAAGVDQVNAELVPAQVETGDEQREVTR